MCDSHFTDAMVSRIEMGEKGRARVVRLYPPLGLYPALTELIVRRALERVETMGLSPGETTLVLVGHGSTKSPASRQATEFHAVRARARSPFRKIWSAYLDEAPYVHETLAALSGPAIVCGLFVENGRHAGQDLPELIRAHGMADPHYLGAIGADPAIITLILRLTGKEQVPTIT
jgi:sirohydrochlorin ferrochelatase